LGAFETPYQTAPLDLFYDSFYRARKEMINERLLEIQDGKAREILEKHDNTYRDKAIMCVGVNWEFCSREDLLDIVDVRSISSGVSKPHSVFVVHRGSDTIDHLPDFLRRLQR
jgi:hypothetical protein